MPREELDEQIKVRVGESIKEGFARASGDCDRLIDRMPNQRDPRKKIVGFWLTKGETRELDRIVADSGAKNRADYVRRLVMRARIRKRASR